MSTQHPVPAWDTKPSEHDLSKRERQRRKLQAIVDAQFYETPPSRPPRPLWSINDFGWTESGLKEIEVQESRRFVQCFPDKAMPPFTRPFDITVEIVRRMDIDWKRIIMKLAGKGQLRKWIREQVRPLFDHNNFDCRKIAQLLHIPVETTEAYLNLLAPGTSELDPDSFDVPYVLTAIAHLHYYAKDQLPVMLSANVRARCLKLGSRFPEWKQRIRAGYEIGQEFKRLVPEYFEWLVGTTSARQAVEDMKRMIKHLTAIHLTKPDIISILKTITHNVSKDITYDSMTAGVTLADQILGHHFQSDLDLALEAMDSMYSSERPLLAFLISSRLVQENKNWWLMVAEHLARHFGHTLPCGHGNKKVHFVCMTRFFNRISDVTERYQAIIEFCSSIPEQEQHEWWQVYFSSTTTPIEEQVLAREKLQYRYEELDEMQRWRQAQRRLDAKRKAARITMLENELRGAEEPDQQDELIRAMMRHIRGTLKTLPQVFELAA